jgi:hypothetical protein
MMCMLIRLGVKYSTCTWYLYLGTACHVLVLVLEDSRIDVLVLVFVLKAKVLEVLASILQVLPSWESQHDDCLK